MSLGRQDVILGRALLAWNLVDRGVLIACANEVAMLTRQGHQVGLGQILVQRGVLSVDRYQAIVARLHQLYLQAPASPAVQQATEQVPLMNESGRYTRTFKRPVLDESSVDRAAQSWRTVAPQVTASGSAIDVHAQQPQGPPKERAQPDAAIRKRLKVPPTQDRFQVGAWVVEDYIADGAWGVVYRVTRLGGDAAPFALKVLKHLDPKPEIKQRFIQEARTMAKLAHPGIVHVHDVGTAGGLLWFVMDFQPGKNLKQVIEEGGPLPYAKGVAVVSKICDAVAYAHERSILHRDLKPENVIMAGGNEPILTDFGLAKDTDSGLNLTMEGQRIGTPFYMAPEMIIEAAAATPQSEVYALGAMLYQCLTGEVPYFAKSLVALSKLVEKGNPPSLRKLCPDAPKALDQLCARTLSRDPDKRPQTVAELRSELESAAT